MVDDDEHQQNMIKHAYSREIEIYNYQVNIDNYNAIMTTLPQDEWPENIIQWKFTPTDQLPFTLSDQDVDIIHDYQYRDRISVLLRTEKAEQTKSSRLRDALKLQITGDYTALLQAYKTSLTTPPTTP
jgi:hypothetical protein